VGGEIAFVHKSTITVRARKLPVIQMFIEMTLQIHLLLKRLPAASHRAFIRLIPGVTP